MNFLELKPGVSVSGDPITVLKSETKGDKHLYLIAGVHGDEVEGVYVLQQLLAELEEDEELNLPLVIIPILNVDGYRNGTRGNSHGVDLNRNLPSSKWSARFEDKRYNPGSAPLSESENKLLAKIFQKYPPGLIISFHSWKRLLNYDGNCVGIAKLLGKYNNYPIVDTIGYATPGSLGEYSLENFNAPVLTLELPKLAEGLTLKQVWEENHVGLTHLMHSGILENYL